jgi:hypothetical protein
MTFISQGRTAAALALGASLSLAVSSAALACACGCGIFDVGAGSFMPNTSDSGWSAWFRYSYMDQTQNWEGSSKGAAADNGDKRIDTSFYTVGAQYVINRSWTVMAELPTYQRALTTTDDGTVFGAAGSVYTGRLTDLGDLQVTGTYTGFSADQSTGVSLGLKLPTGDYTGPIGPLGGYEFDRDSLPGTGSTDIMVGGYHVGRLNAANTLSYFVQGRYQAAVMTRDGYRPGNEFDSAFGLTYNFGRVGPFAKVAPVVQVLNSWRLHDTGPEADTLNSGYERVLIAPGVDMRLTPKVRVYADVALPLYQHVNSAPSVAIEGTSGQLVAPALFKIQFAYDF